MFLAEFPDFPWKLGTVQIKEGKKEKERERTGIYM